MFQAVPSSLGSGRALTVHVLQALRISLAAQHLLRVQQFENNYITEMCSGSDAGSYLSLIDFVYHSTLGLRVIKKEKKKKKRSGRRFQVVSFLVQGVGCGIQGV